MKKAIFLSFLWILPLAVFAQQSVSGTITDASTGEALIGVTVQVKGTATGVITGPDGTYAVNLSGAGDTLVFSYIGFETVEVPVGNRTQIDISGVQSHP